MNPIDNQMNRLFRAAAQGITAKAQTEQVSLAPFGLETRALAAWRTSRLVEASFWDMTILVRGLIVASVIMAVSFLPVLNSTDTTPANPFAEYLQLTDSTVPSDDAQ
jgi:hypothetical protein